MDIKIIYFMAYKQYMDVLKICIAQYILQNTLHELNNENGGETKIIILHYYSQKSH